MTHWETRIFYAQKKNWKKKLHFKTNLHKMIHFSWIEQDGASWQDMLKLLYVRRLHIKFYEIRVKNVPVMILCFDPNGSFFSFRKKHGCHLEELIWEFFEIFALKNKSASGLRYFLEADLFHISFFSISMQINSSKWEWRGIDL